MAGQGVSRNVLTYKKHLATEDTEFSEENQTDNRIFYHTKQVILNKWNSVVISLCSRLKRLLLAVISVANRSF